MRAFTLIELLCALAIIALVLSGGLYVFGLAREGVMRQQTKALLHTVAAEVTAMKLKLGAYPTEFSASQNKDPWGNYITYQISADGRQFTLTSPASNLGDPSDDLIYDSSQD